MSEVVFVGTSDAFGAGGRRQSAILLRVAGGSVLLDCGATTGTGLVDLSIEREEIDAILISHFHGDHFSGIPLLLLACLYEDERKRPLSIAGPPGIEARVRALSAAMGHSLGDREWSFGIDFQELPIQGQAAVGPVEVRAFETRHQPDAKPHGMVIRSDGVRVAYSGDTGWFDELPRQVAGSDLFICECTYASFDFAYHLNHDLLAARKDEFDCGRVVLTHLGKEMTDRRGQCAFETADDGTVLKV
jgi:ribonuclease BN (tRNA processing enzyme)